MSEVSFLNQTNEDFKDTDILRGLIEYALKHEKVENAIFSIIFIDDKAMKNLNYQYRHINKTTDVLSFAFEDSMNVNNDSWRMLGEIYISVDKAKEQASEYGHAYLREVSFLMIHGFLHLLGYEHMTDEDEKEMFTRQEEILNGYGITR